MKDGSNKTTHWTQPSLEYVMYDSSNRAQAFFDIRDAVGEDFESGNILAKRTDINKKRRFIFYFNFNERVEYTCIQRKTIQELSHFHIAIS